MGLTRKVGGKYHMMHGGMRKRRITGRRVRRKSRRSRGKRGGSRKSALRSYRRRVRGSKCRGKGPAVCRSLKGCKYVSRGKKRSFCRKRKNTHRK